MKRMEQIVPLTDEMLAQLARLVKYNSVEAEPLPGKPFGEQPAAVLEEALKIASELGFKTVNMDNYCGYAEMGEGKDIIGIAGHLDIVPAGEGWDSDPFTLTRKGDRVYGRGVSDDKGALIASLYAMKLIRESGIHLKKRVRLLFGCNEETGSKCMAYYTAHEEPITAGFTPDGAFPGIFGEKGLCALTLRSKNSRILSMKGGFVTNAVCNHCVTVIPDDAVCKEALEKALADTPLTSFTVAQADGTLTIDAIGAAAHASTPLEGVNAASYTMQALQKAGMKDDFVDFYMDRIGTACDGAGIGCKVADEYGALTLNNGVVKMEDDHILCTIDIRYPVTLNPDKMREFITPYLEDERGVIRFGRMSSPLFCDPQSPLVQNLYRAYTEITGDYDKYKPQVIGGGTYAKSIPGIIAFGCEFPGTDNHIHDKNEVLIISEFQQQVAIYMQAILNLLED